MCGSRWWDFAQALAVAKVLPEIIVNVRHSSSPLTWLDAFDDFKLEANFVLRRSVSSCFATERRLRWSQSMTYCKLH